MANSNKCKRCEEIETYKHLIWECRETKKIWQMLNEFLIKINQKNNRALEYENVFRIGNIANLSKLKVRLIQAMIQIERPINWTMEKIIKIANDIKNIEIYNAKVLNK